MYSAIFLAIAPLVAAIETNPGGDMSESTSTRTVQVTAPEVTSTSIIACGPGGCQSNETSITSLETLRITSTIMTEVTTTITPYNSTTTICNETMPSISDSHVTDVSAIPSSASSLPVITVTKTPGPQVSDQSTTVMDDTPETSITSDGDCSNVTSTTVITITVTASQPPISSHLYPNTTSITPPHLNSSTTEVNPTTSSSSELTTTNTITSVGTSSHSQTSTSAHPTGTIIPYFGSARSMRPHPIFALIVALPKFVAGSSFAGERRQSIGPQETKSFREKLTLSSTETSTVTVSAIQQAVSGTITSSFVNGTNLTSSPEEWKPCTTVTVDPNTFGRNFTTTVLQTVTVTGQSDVTSYVTGTSTIHNHSSSAPTYNATSSIIKPTITGSDAVRAVDASVGSLLVIAMSTIFLMLASMIGGQ